MTVAKSEQSYSLHRGIPSHQKAEDLLRITEDPYKRLWSRWELNPFVNPLQVNILQTSQSKRLPNRLPVFLKGLKN